MRKYLENDQCANLLPLAANRLEIVTGQRLRAGVPTLTRWFNFSNFQMRIVSSVYGDSVLIMGGGVGHIILSDGVNSWIYDYVNGTFKQGGATLSPESLRPFFLGIVHSDLESVTSTLKPSTFEPVRLPFVARHNHYSTEYIGSDDEISAVIGSEILPLGTMSFDGWDFELSVAGGAFLYLPQIIENEVWNLLGTINLWLYTPVNSNINHQGYWTPNIWFNPWGQGAAEGLHPGALYYDSGIGPCNEIDVDFAGFCTPYSTKGYGYCEILKKTWDIEPDDTLTQTTHGLIAYFVVSDASDPMTIPSNNLEFVQNISNYQYGGTSRTEREATFTLSLDKEIDTVNFWSFDTRNVVKAEGDTSPSYGFVLKDIDDKATLFLRRASLLFTITSVENYRHHAVSADGRKVALFYAVNNETPYTHIVVVDLDVLEEVGAGTKTYDAIDITLINGLDAAWIPLVEKVTEQNPAPVASPTPTGTLVFPEHDQTIEMGQFGGTWISRFRDAAVKYWKLWIEDGIHSHAKVFDDPCFLWRLTYAYPIGAPNNFNADAPVSFSFGSLTYSYPSFWAAMESVPHRLYSDWPGGDANPYIVFAEWENDSVLQPTTTSITGTGVGFAEIQRRPMAVTVDETGRIIVDFEVGDVSYSGPFVFEEIDGYMYIKDRAEECGYLDAVDACNFSAEPLLIEPLEGITAIVGGNGDPLFHVAVNRRVYSARVDCCKIVSIEEYGFDVDNTDCCNPTDHVTVSDECGNEIVQEFATGKESSLINITGPSETFVGAAYTADGTPPFEWSISAGAINNSGVITSLSGACGKLTISVITKDGGCQKGELEVRAPSGQWVFESETDLGDCRWDYLRLCGFGSGSCEEITGLTKTVYSYEYGCSYSGAPSNPLGCTPNGLPPCLTVADTCSPACDYFGNIASLWGHVTKYYTFSWECL